MSTYKTHAINYLWHKAISDKERALISLDLLLENAVGIGDHSTGDYHSNLNEALDTLTDADDRLESLLRYYGTENPDKTEGEQDANQLDGS